VDGATNQLKVNSDHTVTLTDGADPIVNYITIPAAVALGSQAPTLITCLRGDTLRISLPLLGDVTNRTKMVMTAKTNVNDTDGEAALQITEAMGLVRLNGGAYGNSELANLIVRDATTGVVDVTIDAKVTSLLEIGDMVWDVQVFLVSGIVSPISGTLSVVADVTQAVV
jgi:hypothetical protein